MLGRFCTIHEFPCWRSGAAKDCLSFASCQILASVSLWPFHPRVARNFENASGTFPLPLGQVKKLRKKATACLTFLEKRSIHATLITTFCLLEKWGALCSSNNADKHSNLPRKLSSSRPKSTYVEISPPWMPLLLFLGINYSFLLISHFFPLSS